MSKLKQRKPPKRDSKKDEHGKPNDKVLPPLLLNRRPTSPHHLYIPELHRQQTRVFSNLGPVATALDTFTLDDNVSSERDAHTEATELVESIYLGLSRNQKGLKFREFFLANGFCHWQRKVERRVICIIPIEVNGLGTHRHDSGAVLFTLPSDTTADKMRKDLKAAKSPANAAISKDRANGCAECVEKWKSACEKENGKTTDLISDDFEKERYVSSRKMHSMLMTIIGKGLMAKGVDKTRLNFDSTDSLLEVALSDVKDWVLEIVPCLAMKGNSEIFCHKPFGTWLQDCHETPRSDSSSPIHSLRSSVMSLADGYNRNTISCNSTQDVVQISQKYADVLKPLNMTNPNALRGNAAFDSNDTTKCHYDVTWFSCSVSKENTLLNNIHQTDNGMRITAVKIVYKLCQCDWRLTDITIYHVLTAMLHDMDHQLDLSPRWQRERLEQCTRAILNKLRDFAHAQCLPHFSVHGVNLWSYLPIKRLSLMSGALDRLTANDVALVSLVCRAGGISVPTGVDIYSSFLSFSTSNNVKTISDRHVGIKQPLHPKRWM